MAAALWHQQYHLWKESAWARGSLLVMVSGGRDSMALAEMTRQLAGPLGLRWTLGHVHHGGTSLARAEARDFCRAWAQEKGVPTLVAQSESDLQSEEEAREFRRATAETWFREGRFQAILWGHHAEDLLETRLFRLLRGTGTEGFVAMQEWQAPHARPFLAISPREIEQWCKSQSLRWIEDPTNATSDYTRNWLRREWLPALESRQPGAVRSLASSLQKIAEALETKHEFEGESRWADEGLSRPWLLTLSRVEQRRALARYCSVLGLRDYTHNQIEEILKHLDNPENAHMLLLSHSEWRFNAQHIRAFRRGERRA